MHASVVVAVLLMVPMFLAAPAGARRSCPKAPRADIVDVTSSADTPFRLTHAREVITVGRHRGAPLTFFVAGRIRGGPADGKVGVWVEVYLTRRARAPIVLAFDETARLATPNQGTDLDPAAFADPRGRDYRRVVACAS